MSAVSWRHLGLAVAVLVVTSACVDNVEQRRYSARFDVAALDVPIGPGPDTGRLDTWVDRDVADTTTIPDTWVAPDTTTWPDTEWVDADVVSSLCSGNVDCGGVRPYCDRATGSCVGCLSYLECPTPRPICDSATSTCGTTTCTRDWHCNTPFEVCSAFLADSTRGTCVAACLAFQPAGTGGCPTGAWCSPAIEEPGIGLCVPSHAGAPAGGTCLPGDSAFAQGSCADHNACLPTSAGGACHAYCDVNALAGAPGDRCVTGETCLQVPYTDTDTGAYIESAFGLCFPTCGFHEGVPCEGGLACTPAELLGVDHDICFDMPILAEFESCLPFGLSEGEMCGPTAVCIDFMEPDHPGPTCREVCLDTPGHPVGSYYHPDCSRPGAKCEAVFDVAELGLCI